MLVMVVQLLPLSNEYSMVNVLVLSSEALQRMTSVSPGTQVSSPKGYITFTAGAITWYATTKSCGPCGTLVPETVTVKLPAGGSLITTCSILLRLSIPSIATLVTFPDVGLSING